MDFEFKLPDIGEGITEGEIVAWHVKEGDEVKEDDALVDVMTDKATVTISSPKTGVVSKRHFEEGAMAPVGDVLVVIEVGGKAEAQPKEAPKEAPKEEAPKEEAPAPKAEKREPEKREPEKKERAEAREPEKREPEKKERAEAREPEKREPEKKERAEAREPEKREPEREAPRREPAAPSAPALSQDEERPHTLATPATRRLARELNVDIHDIEGTGKGGRITKEDVLAFASRPRAEKPAPSAAPSAAPQPAPAAVPADERGREERVPLRGLRRRIHAKMTQAKHTAAHFHYVEEVDFTELVAMRARLKDKAAAKGVKLTFLPFIVKACVTALKEHEIINAAMDDEAEEIVLRRWYDIGIAAATEAGLTVPVVHDADRKSIYDIARDIERLSERAREGKLDREDLTGSTFTITSLGKIGGMFATPIVNYPEVAILGIHKIEKRPVVVGDQIVIRDRMYLSSSFDHRVIDGHVGAAFVQRIKELLEDPETLLLEMA